MLTDKELRTAAQWPATEYERIMARELLAAREVVRAAKALNQYETAGADEEPPHLYWEEHYTALAESVKRYDEATR